MPLPPRVRVRGKNKVCEYINDKGLIQMITPVMSNWYILYISRPAVESLSFQKKFRRRFRLPHNQFLQFVVDARDSNWFPRWTRPDATGRASSPLELMVLGAFRYLGRGWTFDDIEENTGISQETHRQFFHAFIEVGSTILYKKYVRTPTNPLEAEHHMFEMTQAGFPGCLGSTDATHVSIERCFNRLRNQHISSKVPCLYSQDLV